MKNLFEKFDVDSVARNEDILPYLKGNGWFQQATRKRVSGEMTELQRKINLFDDKRLEMVQGLKVLLNLQAEILGRPASEDRSKRLGELSRKASHLKQRLSDAYRSFLRNSYRRYLAPESGHEAQDPVVQEMRNDPARRFESIVKSDVEKCFDIISAFNQRCREAK